METMDILTQIEQGVLTITFNRPEKKNAITQAMYQAMADALRAAEQDNAVRAIILTGQPGIFTAGNDLEDFMKNAASIANPSAVPPVYQFMRALNECGKPVIAAVSGAAVGIGTTLLLHCDLVYLADNAKLSMPFSQLGLCPEFASSLLVAQAAGHARAAEKLLLGEAFAAQEAFEMGIVTKVLPAAELLPIGVFHPPGHHRLVAQVVLILQVMQRHHQPRVDPRRSGLPVKCLPKLLFKPSPVDRPAQLHQRMRQIHQTRQLNPEHLPLRIINRRLRLHRFPSFVV